MKNIIVAIFDVESEGYQAISNLKKAPVTEDYAILQMALVKTDDGKVTVGEGFDSGVNTIDNTVKGGLIGGLVGILGGPIGVLLMGTYGAMAGRFVDMGDALDGASMIEMVVGKLGNGTSALVILADEKNEAALDACIKDNFKAEVLRYDAAAIEAEVKEAAKMEEEMARQARIQLRKDVRADLRQKAKERRTMLQEEFNEVRDKMEEFGVDANVE